MTATTPAAPGPVFVSHSSEDAALCQQLVDALEQLGLPSWIAPRDIVPGQPYGEQIMLGLEQASAVLLVLSGAANRSKFVVREIERAVSLGTLVIPVRIEDVKPAKGLELFVAAAHWIEAQGRTPSAVAADVAQALRLAVADPGARLLPARPGLTARLWRSVQHARRGVVAAAGVGAVLSGLLGFWSVYKTIQTDVPLLKTAVVMPTLSIAVLPFANLTGDAAQAYVADGLTVAMTADLSRIRDAYIINGATAAAYKARNRETSLLQIGQDLGVRFVLQGSVQRNGSHLRINAQLADTQSGAQLWTESFDGDQSDLFALQDQVTTRIGNSIGREMIITTARQSEKQKSSVKAADLTLRLRAMALTHRTQDHFNKLEALGQEILSLEPDNVQALTLLAVNMMLRATYFRHTLAGQDVEQYADRARDLALKVKQLDPDQPRIYLGLALYAEMHDDYPGAMRAAETVVALAPKEPISWNLLGHVLLLGGEPKKGLAAVQRGIDLDPKHPPDQLLFNQAWAHFMLGDYKASIQGFAKTIETNPTYIDAYGWMAMAYAQIGDAGKARELAARWREADPGASFFLRRQPMSSSPAAFKDFHRKVYEPAARKAGLRS